MSFSSVFQPHTITAISETTAQTTGTLFNPLAKKNHYTLADFPALISPGAQPHLEQLAAKAKSLTRQRFGNTIQLFAPLYISNLCHNTCTYCGFSVRNKTKRIVLTDTQIITEAQALKDKGFRHIILLTGEAEKQAGLSYIVNAVKLIRPFFESIGIEVQPFDEADYITLKKAGVDTLTVYQETYHPEAYKKYHLSGKKKDSNYRIDTADRAAAAEFYSLNIGALYGLYDWRYESIALAHHLDYLYKNHWKSRYAVSFPRITQATGDFKPEYPFSDIHMVQAMIAFRLVFPDVSITLSTRESPQLRDNLLNLGLITQMSAESRTNPGGYAVYPQASEAQFEISDHRSLQDIQTTILKHGLMPVYKDWDRTFSR